MTKTPIRRALGRDAQTPQAAIDQRARLWLLRGLLAADGWRRLVSAWERACDDDEWGSEEAALQALLGIDAGDGRPSRGAWRRALKAALRRAEKAAWPQIPAVRTLAADLGLSELEQALLVFAAMAKHRGTFQMAVAYFGRVRSRGDVIHWIAICLKATPEAVAAVLTRTSVLMTTGLVGVESAEVGQDLDDWLETVPNLLSRLHEPDLCAAALLARYVKPVTGAPRALADFAHLTGVITLMRPLLDQASRGHKGVNILLYGPPGTGKTTLAQALAADLPARLLEVAVMDEDGDGLSREGRVRALRLVAYLGAATGRTIVLFDEIEDYFREEYEFPGPRSRTGPGKGYSVDLLEQAAAPTIWITNSIEDIDPALLRRFSLACEIPPPPAAVRARLVAEYLSPLGLADHPIAACMARHETLVPGVLAQAAKTTAIADRPDRDSRAAFCEGTLNNLLTILGQARLPSLSASALRYDHEYLSADCDLTALVAGIQAAGSARLLCVGPPGTGKSAWARHVAATLGRPLVSYRASDLLDPYVGMAERHISQMFARARGQGAILLLDECDSFLRNRAHAHRSWEVTQVNEMLTQMEEFDGIFLATTNTLEDLDDAVFRRFDRTLTFKPLSGVQRRTLMIRVLADHGLPAVLSASECQVIDDCEGLTVGDVAAVVKGLRLQGTKTAAAFVDAVAAAWRIRHRKASRVMGFMAAVS
ncbi:AAA family ATPase [Acidiferrobacter sp.]|uniref:AAA family ATPase n=1 Tax=Acidiferrobacter sp. TaxID=1872107 RepID=UPI00261862C2|nr:AAA family ATPase [Acidiferrobacter sp.]